VEFCLAFCSELAARNGKRDREIEEERMVDSVAAKSQRQLGSPAQF
jgi:hypothetical protein